MFKIDSEGASPDNEFLDDSVGVSGTVVSAEWLNAVQRELLAILDAAGIAPSKVDDDQIITAIEQLIAAGGGGGGGGGSQYWRDAVATTGDLPTGVNAGTICLVTATNVLYRYNGSAWVIFYRVSDFLTTSANTDALAEGSTNKYFTDERAQDAIGAMVIDSSTIDATYNDGSNTLSLAVIPSAIEVNSLAATSPLSLAKGGSGGTTAQAGADTYGGVLPEYITASQTAVKNKIYLIDTTSGSVTLTLPPIAGGGRVKIIDIAGKWGVNPVTVAPTSGQKIQGLAIDATKSFSLPNGWAEFYVNPSVEWGVQTTIPGLQGSQVYGGFQSAVISSNTNLVNGTLYQTNTTSAGFTGTLPSGVAGMHIKIVDDKETWDVNAFILAPFTGQTIGQNAANVTITCNIKRGWIEVWHDGTTWVILSFASTVLSPGSGLTGIQRNAATAATNGNMYECDTTAGGFTVTLPGGTTPAVVGVLDAGPFFTTNNLIVAPATGQSIDNMVANDTLTIDVNRANVVFYRANGSTVWEIQTSSYAPVSPASSLEAGTVSYENTATKVSVVTGLTTTPNATIRMSRIGKSVQITISAIGAGGVKNASAGALTMQLDPAWYPATTISAVQFIAVGTGVVALTHISTSGLITVLGASGGNIPANQTTVGWDYGLTFNYQAV